MSARDKLIEIFEAGGPHHIFSPEEVADDILGQYAYELAEEIRSYPWRECCGGGCSDMPDDVADFIDPEGNYERT